MSTTTTGTRPDARTTTRALLACGIAAGPLYVVAGLVQAYTRTGFDLEQHAFSLLSNGELGWVQITIFVVSGLLFLAGAVGMRRALRDTGRGSTWGPLLIAGIGVGLIGGGVFVADPAYGFPAGAPAGSPAVISWHSDLHFVAFVVGIGSLLAAFFVFARRFSALAQRGMARASVLVAVAFIGLSAIGMVFSDFRIVTVAIALGWGWVSAVTWRQLREQV